MVMLFDLGHSVDAYIQSRGRARAPGSRLLVLCTGDGSDEATLKALASSELLMRDATVERAARLATDVDAEDDCEAARGTGSASECYTVEATGAYIYVADAVSRLEHFAAKMPSDKWSEPWRPEYALAGGAGAPFTCTAADGSAAADGAALRRRRRQQTRGALQRRIQGRDGPPPGRPPELALAAHGCGRGRAAASLADDTAMREACSCIGDMSQSPQRFQAKARTAALHSGLQLPAPACACARMISR